MQYRHVGYKTDGYNDKFRYNKQTYLYEKHHLDIDKKYDFLNPKAGFSFHQGGHHAKEIKKRKFFSKDVSYCAYRHM